MRKLQVSLSAAAVAAVMAWAGSASAAIIVPYSSDVVLSFDGGDAAYNEEISVIIGSTTDSDIFDNKTTTFGSTLDLGVLAGGTQITITDYIKNTGYTWSTTTGANADGMDHVKIATVSPSQIYVGFEDQYGLGDKDFNDNQVLLTFAAVPEISTWGMMLAGFGGLGYAAFRRSKKSGVSFLSA
jgi:hypothetical protein